MAASWPVVWTIEEAEKETSPPEAKACHLTRRSAALRPWAVVFSELSPCQHYGRHEQTRALSFHTPDQGDAFCLVYK